VKPRLGRAPWPVEPSRHSLEAGFSIGLLQPFLPKGRHWPPGRPSELGGAEPAFGKNQAPSCFRRPAVDPAGGREPDVVVSCSPDRRGHGGFSECWRRGGNRRQGSFPNGVQPWPSPEDLQSRATRCQQGPLSPPGPPEPKAGPVRSSGIPPQAAKGPFEAPRASASKKAAKNSSARCWFLTNKRGHPPQASGGESRGPRWNGKKNRPRPPAGQANQGLVSQS